MARQVTLSGNIIKLYINNKIYNAVQSISFSVNYGTEEIRGIDSINPQELAPGPMSVRGSVNGIRIKNSGGIQAQKMRPTFADSWATSYISIRIQDRVTGEDILFIPEASITNENHSVSAKSTYKMSFEFVGKIPLFALDRS